MDAEIKNMFANSTEVAIGADAISFSNYLFRSSVAFKQGKILAKQIANIDVGAAPPTIRIDRELVFISAKYRDDLRVFADRNQIPIVRRIDTWSLIAEPYLDTEYTDDMHQKIIAKLGSYGLDESEVLAIRHEIEDQMIKYNFESAFWEWVHLGAYDVLNAMKTKYNDLKFVDFYDRVMEIALITEMELGN